MPALVIAIYLVLCVLVGILGRGTRLGFFRCFLFSVLLTPFPVTIALLLINTLGSGDKELRRANRERT